MLRRSLAPWLVMLGTLAFGAWTESTTGYAWEWADLLAGIIVAAAGAWIWRTGHWIAGIAMTLVAIGWFLGTVATTFDLSYAEELRMARVHRPLLLVAVVAVSLISIRSKRWRAVAVAATSAAVVGWAIHPQMPVATTTAVVVAAIGVVCRMAARPVSESRWLAPWLPALVWAVVVGASALQWWTTPAYSSLFAMTALLAGVAATSPRPHPGRSMAIDLGIVDARRRRGEVRLDIAGPDETVDVGPMRSSIDLADGARLVVDHPAGATLTPAMRGELRRAGMLMAAHRRLTEGLQRQTATVASSRERLATATDRERQRFQRDVLATVVPHLDRLRDQLPADAELIHRLVADTRRDVSALCSGTTPSTLADGFAPAVQALAASCPVPVDVSMAAIPATPAVDSAVWFVIAEAVANAVRHAGASRIDIDVAKRQGDLVVRITDDGRGGCDESVGSGLAGLRDRAALAGGALNVASDPGRGTCVELVIPHADGVGA